MKRQFTGLRGQKIGFESTFTCREDVSTQTTSDKSVSLNQMLFFEKWLKMILELDIQKLITSKTFIHLFIIFLIFLCGKTHKHFLQIRCVKHFDNSRQHLILLIVTQNFPNGTTVTHRESIIGNSQPFSKTSLSIF